MVVIIVVVGVYSECMLSIIALSYTVACILWRDILWHGRRRRRRRCRRCRLVRRSEIHFPKSSQRPSRPTTVSRQSINQSSTLTKILVVAIGDTVL